MVGSRRLIERVKSFVLSLNFTSHAVPGDWAAIRFEGARQDIFQCKVDGWQHLAKLARPE